MSFYERKWTRGVSAYGGLYLAWVSKKRSIKQIRWKKWARKRQEFNFFCISRQVYLQTERQWRTEVQHMIQKADSEPAQSAKIQKLQGWMKWGRKISMGCSERLRAHCKFGRQVRISCDPSLFSLGKESRRDLFEMSVVCWETQAAVSQEHR